MPVTFGASTTVSGAGTWTYPDGDLVKAVKVDLASHPGNGGHIGSTLERWKGIGVYTLNSAAGEGYIRTAFQASRVDYDVGPVPTSVTYELNSGASLTFTEVLDETGTGGGGGTAVTAAVVYDWSSAIVIPDSSWTTISTTEVSAETNSSVLAATPAGAATVHLTGVYLFVAFLNIAGASTSTVAAARFVVNGSAFGSVEAAYDVPDTGLNISMSFMHNFSAGDVLSYQVYQATGSSQDVWGVMSYAYIAS